MWSDNPVCTKWWTTPSSVCRSFPVAISKILMIPSMAPLARYFPSGLCREHMKIIWNSMLLSHPLSNTSNLLVPGLTGWLANKASSFLVRLMQNVYQGIQQARRGNWKNQIETKQYFLTYAILRMNFPLVSKEYSFFPLSTPKMFTFPTWVPVARYWESGEKAKVQASTEQKKRKNYSSDIVQKISWVCGQVEQLIVSNHEGFCTQPPSLPFFCYFSTLPAGGTTVTEQTFHSRVCNFIFLP